jgi:hypothetical protein
MSMPNGRNVAMPSQPADANWRRSIAAPSMPSESPTSTSRATSGSRTAPVTRRFQAVSFCGQCRRM